MLWGWKQQEMKGRKEKIFLRTNVVPGFLILNCAVPTELTNQCKIKNGSWSPPYIAPLILVNSFVLDRCE